MSTPIGHAGPTADGSQRSLPAWVDDGPLVGEEGAIGPFDAGLRSGLGVFESLRAHGTATLAADLHVARLLAGAARIGIDVTRARVEDALATLLALPRAHHEVAVRITLTAGPVDSTDWPPTPVGRPLLAITLHPAPPLPSPPVSGVRIGARRWPADVKSTSYLASVLAQREARAAGADVAVLHDGDELLETAEGNLLAIVGDRLHTPPADGRILAGVTRTLVLAAAADLGLEPTVAPLRVDDALAADAVLVTSAVSGVRTLHGLDGTDVRGSGVGEALHPLVGPLRATLEAQRR